MLGNDRKIKVTDIDIRNYAKYTLREGVMIEKQEMFQILKVKSHLRTKR